MATTDELIDSILTDPAKGILPNLEAELGSSFGRFQIRPWSFNQVYEGSGYRIRQVVDERPKQQNNGKVTFELKIGYIILVSDEALTQIEGLKVSLTINRIVFKLSDCGVYRPIDISDGMIQTRQNKNKSKDWYVVITRTFLIEFDYYL